MRLALPTFLALSVLPTSAAQRYDPGAVAKGRDGTPRRRVKAKSEKGHYAVGDLRVKVSSKSGEISLSRAKMGTKKNKESIVKILIESVEEVGAGGNAVGSGKGEAEAHAISLRDAEFEIAAEQYDVPVEIEDDADATAADGGSVSADADALGLTDEENGEGRTEDIADAVDGYDGETHNDVDIVDTVDEEGGETSAGSHGDPTDAFFSTEEADGSAVAAAGSDEEDGAEAPLVVPAPKEDDIVEPHVNVFCVEDVRVCPDGSQVYRDSENDCEFAPCPGSRRRLQDIDAASPPPIEEEGESAVIWGAEDPEVDPEPEKETMGDVSATPADGGAEGTNVTLYATLQTESDLRVETLLISRGGAVGTKSERWAVRPGDMKFNLQLTRWSFCDPCADGTGEFVDVRIRIKGKRAGGPGRKDRGARIEAADAPTGPGKKGGADEGAGRKRKRRREERAWDLGEGATLDLTSRVRVDGVWTDMPAGYPKLVDEGGRQHYTLRFPRFNDTVWYDPVVTFNEEFDSETETSAAFRLASRLATCAGLLLACALM